MINKFLNLIYDYHFCYATSIPVNNLFFVVMIILESLSKSFGSRTLFENVNISFNEGNRYGLTGPNGSGKSTLLKIIMGMEKASSGNVILPDRVGILRQNIEDYQETRIIDAVIMGNYRLWQALEERDLLYEKEMDDEVGLRLGDLEEIILEENGYSAESDAEVLLQGMSISPDHYENKMASIPLDLQFRVLLCQSLFGNPQALLLDEPTNHLDMESIAWLENFLSQYKGVLVVVSHDRHFLNSITNFIADIDYETVIIYPGNYDDMIFAKTSMRSSEENELRSKEKKIAKLKDFVSKFRAGTRASQVQSRIREINRLQPQELKKSNIQRPYIRFIPSDKQSGKIVFKVEDINKSYEQGKPVIKDFSMEIHRGDKIGVIGNNGRGKTTLLKMLADALHYDNGSIEKGHQVQVSYFPQNHSDIISENETIQAFEWLRKKKTGLYDQDIRSAMGKMLFSGDDAFKEVNKLSGGETARLIFAGMMLEEHNVLILDEPNNHLDLEAVSALSWALEEYKGTCIVASHNRDLLESVADKIIAFEGDSIIFHEGDLKEYLSHKQPSLKT